MFVQSRCQHATTGIWQFQYMRYGPSSEVMIPWDSVSILLTFYSENIFFQIILKLENLAGLTSFPS